MTVSDRMVAIAAAKEAKALANMALMRDQKTVFYGVREVLNRDLTDAGKLAEISDYYAAFDAAHPA